MSCTSTDHTRNGHPSGSVLRICETCKETRYQTTQNDDLEQCLIAQAEDDWSARFLITFASRAVADEWWRAITNSIQRGYTRFNQIVRHSAQFYSHNGQILDTITDKEVTRASDTHFLNTVFFTLLDDRSGRHISPAPVLNYTDHRSGNR